MYSNDGESKVWVMETDLQFGDNVAHVVSGLLVPQEWIKSGSKGSKKPSGSEDEDD